MIRKNGNSVTYNNRQYWPALHERLKGQLKAVGHPFLSEELNRLKYASEAESVGLALQTVVKAFHKKNPQVFSFLDVGAGTGFWTDLISNLFLSHGYQADITALDVSGDALEVIRERLPGVRGIQEDLATITPDKFSGMYDLVSACYCFHHIVKTRDFINALQFAGSSVKQDGFLLLMDPILRRPYSTLDTIDIYSFRGNGIPRPLYLIDDVLLDAGFRRVGLFPAVSFVLNGCIEARGPFAYFLMNKLWKTLCVFYRSERLVRSTAGVLQSVDQALKQRELAFSSSVCLYQKING